MNVWEHEKEASITNEHAITNMPHRGFHTIDDASIQWRIHLSSASLQSPLYTLKIFATYTTLSDAKEIQKYLQCIKRWKSFRSIFSWKNPLDFYIAISYFWHISIYIHIQQKKKKGKTFLPSYKSSYYIKCVLVLKAVFGRYVMDPC